MKYVVSACLAGIKCTWDGKAKPNKKVIDLVEQGKAIPVCPEQLGLLSTPRPPAGIKAGRVFTKDGKDITKKFQKGAEKALRIAKKAGCQRAILKSKSPSCGSGKIFDGTFSGNLIESDGIFAALLKSHGIKVLTEKEI